MTNKAIFSTDLGDVGRQWVQQCLSGSVCLGSLLLPELDLTEGEAVVLGAHGELPHDTVGRLAESVSHLDVLDEGDRAAALLELFISLQATVGEFMVLVEDYLLSPDHEHTQTLIATGKAIVAGGTVFHICDGSSLVVANDVVEMFGGGSEYPLNAFVFQEDAERGVIGWIENQERKRLAEALIGTVHAVYDAEGYIAWIRTTDAFISKDARATLSRHSP